MALFSRADFDEEMALIEELRHLARTAFLEGMLTGFKLNTVQDRLDERERKAKGRLFATAMTMESADKERKKKRSTVSQQPIVVTQVKIISKGGK